MSIPLLDRPKPLRNDVELPQQLGLPFYGKTIDVDGIQDSTRPGIEYWGVARHVFDDTYRCLANVGGTLCAVEVTIRPHDHLPPGPAARI